MSSVYNPDALRAEAASVTIVNNYGDEQTVGHRIITIQNQLEALTQELGAVEEKISPIVRPMRTRVNLEGGSVDARDDSNTSPLGVDLDAVTDRILKLRQRLQDLLERIEL